MPAPEILHSDLPWLTIHDCRETLFFSTHEGQLCQWLELEMTASAWRPDLTLEIRTAGRAAKHHIVFFPTLGSQRATVRAYAPARWPRPADPDARLIIHCGDARLEAKITVGSHRPWTVYVLSDLCADDTWAFKNLKKHDREDYLTTLAELRASPDNRYNLAANYQVERFIRQAKPAERRALRTALRTGRFFATPTPNQLNCGAFLLSAYPSLLEPFRRYYQQAGLKPADFPPDAYHMEAPTWTNGYLALLAAAGFRSFAKSLLGFYAPWLEPMKALPRLTRLEVTPANWMYLLWRIGDYSEASPILAGLPCTNDFLHGKAIPRHEEFGEKYPTSALPLVGSYSDLSTTTKDWAALKVANIDQYNRQGWQYPRLVNATWPQFFDHVEKEAGPPQHPRPHAAKALAPVRGDIGSSWEAWMLAAAREHARFRAAQRDVVSLRTLTSLLPADSRSRQLLDDMAFQVIQLGDHAWNGSSPEGKTLNLQIRRRRLVKAEKIASSLRRRYAGSHAKRFAVLNTLGWQRDCRITLPFSAASLRDPATGERFAVHADSESTTALIPGVPAFGTRALEIGDGAVTLAADTAPPALRPAAMTPTLEIEAADVPPTGGWRDDTTGSWTLGPFTIDATLAPADDATELTIRVHGQPPQKPHDLRFRFDLPWPRCSWRGESGGAFVTPGPTECGGDSLLGIVGAVFAAGEGISAIAPDASESLDFALRESAICRLGATAGPPAKDAPKAGNNQQWPWIWTDTSSGGELHWCLLGNGQNNESFEDQGGDRQWTFRCAIRRRPGGADDAALYRFAASYNCPGEIVSPRIAAALIEPPLQITGGHSVLVLGLHREAKSIAIDLYNTASKPQSIRLAGPLLRNKKLHQADMLSRVLRACANGRVTVAPKAYSRLMVR